MANNIKDKLKIMADKKEKQGEENGTNKKVEESVVVEEKEPVENLHWSKKW